MSEIFDYIVIGAGFAGGTLAALATLIETETRPGPAVQSDTKGADLVMGKPALAPLHV